MAGCECCDNFSMIDGGDEFKAFPGLKGDDGTTFYPHVSAEGIISWTNDGGKPNPDPVNIKGTDGESAYQAAVEAGFSGTEAEFNEYLSGIGVLTEEVTQQKSAIDDLTALTNRKAGMLVDTASGAIASFVPDSTVPNLLGVTVAVEPQQDLHGQASPWPAGGGKNKLPTITAATTLAGVTWTPTSDGKIIANGTATANSVIDLGRNVLTLPAGVYTTNLSVLDQYDVNVFKLVGGSGVILAQGGGTFTLTEEASIFVRFAVISGRTVNNVTIEPMLETGSSRTTFAPYENLCPISGWSAVTMQRTGKNLFAFSEVKSKRIYRANILPFTGSNNSCYLTGAAGATESNQLNVSSWAFVGLQMSANPLKTETKVTLSCNIQNFTDLGGATGFVKLSYCDANFANSVDAVTATFSAIGKTPISISATIPAGKYLCVRATPVSKGSEVTLSQYTEMTDIQLEIGTTASAFKPYAGNTYTITIGQTVYGGVLDVEAGTMTVDRANIASYNGETLPGEWISDRDVYSAGATPTIGAQVVYKLATPITIQLDPVTISTIANQTNNLWSDAGDVDVTYAADIKAYIDRLNQPAEDDMIANSQIQSGKYFTVNNRLFLSTASIAAGAQIIPGTNCTETSLAAALNALNA